MNRARKGFTLIEVTLFLAVTSALFVGIAAATQNSIFQQRFTDSVQNFAEFLRSVYAQVANVQNEKTGRSGQAIYGKVLTFDVDDNGQNKIKSYNLIADVEYREVIDSTGNNNCNNQSNVISKLACLNANVVSDKYDDSGQLHTVGFVEDYSPRWSAGIQTIDAWSDSTQYTPFKGIIVITHSPDSGNIFSYVMTPNYSELEEHPEKYGEVEEVEDVVDTILGQIEACDNPTECMSNPLMYMTGGSLQHAFTASTSNGTPLFNTNEVNFCINPYGDERTSLRRNIRIPRGNHTASGVQVVDDSINACE